jgi:1-acyl-sn-glycerol-3-phosphate acyltransferase
VSRAFWFLLNLFHALYTALWSAFWISCALVVRLLTGGTRVPLAMARRIWAPGLLWRSVMRVEVEGLERIDFSRPHIFAANHQSLLDVPLLFASLPVPLLFVLKKELARVPFLGAYVKAMGMILVERGRYRSSLGALEQCRDRLASGHSILLFPEGTRSRDGRLQPMKAGIFAPVIETGVPIVPVALDGPHQVLPPGTFRIRPGTLRLALGEPIPTAGKTAADRKEIARRVEAATAELFADLVTRRS